MKWIGVILILFTCTWVGLERSNKYRGRTKQIRECIQALQLMEAEMSYGNVPIKGLFEILTEQLSKPVSTFFEEMSGRMAKTNQPLQHVWTETLEHSKNRLALTKKDLHILHQFGHSLGMHDLIQQKKQIELASIHLHRQLNEAIEEERRFAGMSRTLGFLTGILIVLILI